MIADAESGRLGWEAYLSAGVAVVGLGAMIPASLAAWIGRKGESQTGPRWGATLALGLGTIASIEVVRESWSEERPRQVWQVARTWWKEGGEFPLFPLDAYWSISWVVLAATLVGLFDGDKPAPRWARWENRSILVALLLWLVVAPVFGATWETWADAGSLIALGAGLFAWWTLLEGRAERLGSAMPLMLLIPTAVMSKALMLAHAATLAAMAGGLSAMIGVLWIVSWANRRMCLARGAIPVFAVAFAGLALFGVYGNEMPRPVAILLGLAPLATYIDRIRPIANLSRWKLATVRIVAVAIPAAVALGWAYAKVPPELPM